MILFSITAVPVVYYLQNLEFSTEKLKQVERDYHETLHKLQTKQQEIDSLQKVWASKASAAYGKHKTLFVLLCFSKKSCMPVLTCISYLQFAM